MTREYQDNRLSMSEFSMSSWKLLGPAKFSIRDQKKNIYMSALTPKKLVILSQSVKMWLPMAEREVSSRLWHPFEVSLDEIARIFPVGSAGTPQLCISDVFSCLDPLELGNKEVSSYLSVNVRALGQSSSHSTHKSLGGTAAARDTLRARIFLWLWKFRIWFRFDTVRSATCCQISARQ